MAKRIFDLLLATALLLVLSPVLLIGMGLVRLSSRGPSIYRGLRVGRDGQPFRMLKLRTMRRDADSSGPPLTGAGDPRVTRVGALLRRTKVDELPQLINVIKGEMSLVGPRPEHADYVALYTPEQRAILAVRPGITSPASIALRSQDFQIDSDTLPLMYAEAILPAKLEMDLAYIATRSLPRDILILARTPVALVGDALRHMIAPGHAAGLARRYVPWALIDAPIVALSFVAAYFLRFLDQLNGDSITGLRSLLNALGPLVVLYVGVNWVTRLDSRAWRYATAPEALAIAGRAALSTAIAYAADDYFGRGHQRPIPLGVIVTGGLLCFCGFVAVRYRRRILSHMWRSRLARNTEASDPIRALIYGAGEAGQELAHRLLTLPEGRDYKLVGFLDDARAKKGMSIHGIRVLGGRDDIRRLVRTKHADLVILAMHNIEGQDIRAILEATEITNAQIKIVPNVFDWMAASGHGELLREVRVDDLLGRQTAHTDDRLGDSIIKGKTVLVTGAAGSIGWELCRQIARFKPERLVVVDNNESGLFDLSLDLGSAFRDVPVSAIVGDVTAESSLRRAFADLTPTVVFHVAAYKHVPLMEQFPSEAVRVNVFGTQTTLALAAEYGAERFVLVSTDKAVNPSSVMGASKRLAEMLVLSDALGEDATDGSKLRRTVVRFGNVLGSRGSVVPTFEKQIQTGGPVTVTHPEMTRFFMDIGEAASLIIQAAALTVGGDTLMLEMGESVRVDELARKMIRMRGLRPDVDIEIVYTGVRPGEKLDEELHYAAEEREPTGHPLIYRLSAVPALSARRLSTGLVRLQGLVEGGADEHVAQYVVSLATSTAPVSYPRVLAAESRDN